MEEGESIMKAKIWKHWFKFYIAYYNENGERLPKTDVVNSISEAISEARRWGCSSIFVEH